jgi:hypothetical protein
MRGWHHRHTQKATPLWMQYHEEVEVHYWESEQEKRSAVLLFSWSFGWGPGGAGSGADGKTPWSCREPRQTPRGQHARWGKNFHPAHWTQNNTKEKNQVFVLFKGRTYYYYNIHKRKLEGVTVLIYAVGWVLWTLYTLPWLLYGVWKIIFVFVLVRLP